MTALLELTDVTVRFRGPRRGTWRARPDVAAVDRVSLLVHEGETLGIVGESGSGKSTLARTIVGLQAPTAGRMSFAGRPVPPGTLAGREIQMVFQDPFGSMNPRFDVARIIAEPLHNHEPGLGRSELDGRVCELMDAVRLPRSLVRRRPAELSGGQLQRVGIARALALSPRLLVADEPVSALDVSVQAQVLNLLADLRDERGISCLFIGHNLAVVEHVADRIAVMFAGRIVEVAPADALVDEPAHPYTRALLAAVPGFARTSTVGVDPAAVHTKVAPPSRTGCGFATRCPHALDRCLTDVPEPRILAAGHVVACHRAEDLRSPARPTAVVAPASAADPPGGPPS